MLVVPDAVRNAIIDRAVEGAPNEVCGVLAGTDGNHVRIVDRAIPTPNAAVEPETTYEIDPVTLLETVESIEAGGDDVVGFYHSHPTGPPEPSATDVADATWEGYAYLICSLDPTITLGVWRWTGDRFVRERVRSGLRGSRTREC
ncbi:desampylase [Halovivax gelatinilyticus]|uniref:desampylase n=1 Tax=Halovivax gelatinilyticus TaxID=2961597 RepID=UPI0020CA59CB|nr:desampylase [Halovivax gelatinilyticus]